LSRRRKEAFKFFGKNLLQGLAWFIVILVLLWLGAEYIPDDMKARLDPLRERPFLVYTIFFTSEVFFGIIPPEIFMAWATDQTIIKYIQVITLLTLLSYAGGIIAFFIGKVFSNTGFFRQIKRRQWYHDYSRTYRRFGGILILISAITPVPFALISMISGSFGYRFRNYIRFAAFRVLRFVVYGYFVWHGMSLTLS
jgi:uncharacterized membrane protein YdjX (TVP38/TMEM64 family)